jgi:hypothetical protein
MRNSKIQFLINIAHRPTQHNHTEKIVNQDCNSAQAQLYQHIIRYRQIKMCLLDAVDASVESSMT